MTAAPQNRAVAFLAAFNDIEAFLRDVLGADKSDGFGWMVGLAAKKGHITRTQADDMREYAALRNAISHGPYRDFRPIAEPLPETVVEIERLREALLSPALALDVVGRQQVLTCTPGDSIRVPLDAVRESSISQFPVYEGNRCVGLLTTNAIARWVAADLGADNRIDATTVREALDYAESRDEAIFLPRTVTAAAAVDALTTPLHHGGLPHLAVITEHGKDTQRPLAVVAASDIPSLLDTF